MHNANNYVGTDTLYISHLLSGLFLNKFRKLDIIVLKQGK